MAKPKPIRVITMNKFYERLETIDERRGFDFDVGPKRVIRGKRAVPSLDNLPAIMVVQRLDRATIRSDQHYDRRLLVNLVLVCEHHKTRNPDEQMTYFLTDVKEALGWSHEVFVWQAGTVDDTEDPTQGSVYFQQIGDIMNVRLYKDRISAQFDYEVLYSELMTDGRRV